MAWWKLRVMRKGGHGKSIPSKMLLLDVSIVVLLPWDWVWGFTCAEDFGSAFPTKLQPPATAQICRRPRLRIPGMDTSRCVLGALSLTSGVAISLLQSAACPCSLLPTPIQLANLVAHSHVTKSTLCEKSYRKCLTTEWTTIIGRRTFSPYQIFYLTMNCLRSSPGLLFCLISCFVSSPYA